VSRNRLEAFSDGVVAALITIMVQAQACRAHAKVEGC
jgi:hypothetical protein